MEKRVFFIIGTVLVFFASAILMDYFPILKSALAAVCAGTGFLFGYLYAKKKFAEKVVEFEKKYNGAMIALASASKSTTATEKKKTSKKKES